MLDFLKGLLGGAPAVDFKSLMEEGALIVDVRTPGEYKSGHIKGSVNIPLDTIASQTQSLLKKGVPVITCCRRRGRSGAAVQILRNAGIRAENGGPWDSLQAQL